MSKASGRLNAMHSPLLGMSAGAAGTGDESSDAGRASSAERSAVLNMQQSTADAAHAVQEKRIRRRAKPSKKKAEKQHQPIPIPKTEQDLAEERDKEEFYAGTVEMRAQIEARAVQRARRDSMLKGHYGKGSARGTNLNEDLLIPEWARKDETLKERLSEKKKIAKVNPDRLHPIPAQCMAIKVKPAVNTTLDSSRKGMGSITSLTSEAAR